MAAQIEQIDPIKWIPLDAAFPETTRIKKVGEAVMTKVVETGTGEIVSLDYSGRHRFASISPEQTGNSGNQTQGR